MRLKKFRVTEFRSVEDSGWIETKNVTTLVGANESGKTNLMKALWKLNAAGGVSVEPVKDMPRHKYYSMITASVKPVFITAGFILSPEEIAQIDAMAGVSTGVKYVFIARDYDNKLFYDFSTTEEINDFATAAIKLTNGAMDDAARIQPYDDDYEYASQMRPLLNRVLKELTIPNRQSVSEMLSAVTACLQPIMYAGLSFSKNLSRLIELVKVSEATQMLGLNSDIQRYIYSQMPEFLFYASSGNLDGEILLPQVIENMERSDLRAHEVDRMRTIKNFFILLGKTPQEMLDLGREMDAALADESKASRFLELKDETDRIMRKAEERFNKVVTAWRGECPFRFDFKLDGEYIRVRVVDYDGQDPIELEFRSEWIQWMFSFCLNMVSLRNERYMLLLDEPELALHPISQTDLVKQLNEKSQRTPVLFCTHSCFLIDRDHLDRVVNIYVDDRGYTSSGEDLRISSRKQQIEAGFALSSAVTIGISQALMVGCIPVMTDIVAEQVVLSLFKNLLSSVGELHTRREIIFIPCGGLAGVKAVLPLLVGKNNFLPAFVTGGDRADVVRELVNGASVFAHHKKRAIAVGVETNSRLEDLLPRKLYKTMFGKYIEPLNYSLRDFDFDRDSSSVIEVVEKTLRLRHFTLPSDWRVEVAQMVKQEVLRVGSRAFAQEEEKLDTARALFDALVQL